MVTETLAELEKAAQEIRDGLKNVNEDIKKLTGRDPSDNTRYATPMRQFGLSCKIGQQLSLGQGIFVQAFS